MNNAHIFNMIDRTVADKLPDCSVFVEDEIRVEFHGTEDEVSSIPCRLDIVVENVLLIGDAKLKQIRKNGGNYVAEYEAYAAHYFENGIPS